MPESPFKEPENSKSTEERSEATDTPAVTGVAPEATDSVEPGTTVK